MARRPRLRCLGATEQLRIRITPAPCTCVPPSFSVHCSTVSAQTRPRGRTVWIVMGKCKWKEGPRAASEQRSRRASPTRTTRLTVSPRWDGRLQAPAPSHVRVRDSAQLCSSKSWRSVGRTSRPGSTLRTCARSQILPHKAEHTIVISLIEMFMKWSNIN
jgi:hypothetical protein